MEFFTVCNCAYLPKVYALADSLNMQNGCVLNIVLFDKKRKIKEYEFANIHWIEDLDVPSFSTLSFKYTVIELTTALKPWLAKFFLKSLPTEKIVFLDPDVYVYGSFDYLDDLLNDNPFIVTPHYLTPISHGAVNDQQLMRFGNYNLGFFAANDSMDSISFLTWWEERCFENAFDDPQFGVFTDQKWVTLGKLFFDFIYVIKHPGYNVAYWNLHERTVTSENEKSHNVNNENLVFIHFSSFNFNTPSKLSRNKFDFGANDSGSIEALSEKYKIEVVKYEKSVENNVYSYDYMSNGQYISPTLRRAYFSCFEEFKDIENPFDSKSVVGKFASRNNLLTSVGDNYSAMSFKDVSNNQGKFKFIFFCMRIILRLLGPNKYMSFSRLLVFLSRYHTLPDMWRK
ncbi:hypothetical protein [Shewanella kaireitica]|uniref:hypothetical protein n=1 Tax=Shewanella kaireitica TaxID=212021 RepID=UPI00200D5BD0|nr:hypothetical protein [Shewanella kaireitica]MCL1095726.1 hypothetical protein [Shewanella kaireitica]